VFVCSYVLQFDVTGNVHLIAFDCPRRLIRCWPASHGPQNLILYRPLLP